MRKKSVNLNQISSLVLKIDDTSIYTSSYEVVQHRQDTSVVETLGGADPRPDNKLGLLLGFK